MTRRQNPHELQVYLGCTSKSEWLKNIRRRHVKEEKEALAEVLQDAGWEVDDIIKDMMKAEDFYCERLGVVKLDTWFRYLVTLVGEAAYCPSSNTGMGTTSSMVGAYILAGEIGRHCREDSKDGLAMALKIL